MPYFVDRNLNIYKDNPIISLPELCNTSIVADTEFTKKAVNSIEKFLKVDCIGIYFPELFYDYLVIFTYEELTEDFHPVLSTLQAFNYDIKPANQDYLIEVIDKIQTVVNEVIDFNTNSRQIGKAFKKLKDEGYFDHYLADINVDFDCLKLTKDVSGDYLVTIQPSKVVIPFVFFYGFADFFKIWGKNHQQTILDASLVQQRCLKFRSSYGRELPLTEYNTVNGVLYEFQYPLREVMYRFPPQNKSLDAQTTIFEVSTKKLNVNTWIIANALGFNSLDEIKENFSTFLEKLPDEALQYNAVDIFATWDLNLKQQEFYNIILATFGIEPIDISDTTGSNVSKFLVQCVLKEFCDNSKNAIQLEKDCNNLSESIDNEFNDEYKNLVDTHNQLQFEKTTLQLEKSAIGSKKDLNEKIKLLKKSENNKQLDILNTQFATLDNINAEIKRLNSEIEISKKQITDIENTVENKRTESGLYSLLDELKGIKNNEKLIKKIIQLGNLENLENTPLNDFGCQPFLTVGGLLYTRMARKKYLEGYLSDCDLKSCYASFMSQMNVYLGEPITLTCKYDKYKITLREALELIENQKAPHDGWFIRVSGNLDKAINTLVLSDLRFKPKSVKQQQLYEVNESRKSVEKFNAFKTSKRSAESTLLTKQIKFGLITKSTIETLKKLPSDWYKEYLDLKCDVVCYFPGDLIAYDLPEYLKLRASLPEESCIEKFDIKNGFKEVQNHHYQNNAVLAFPINKYWLELKTNRNKFKKAKNPIQEVFKLFQNSGYGVLACLYLAMNNLMASNQITAGARSGAWLMTNAINGMGSITDGTAYSWQHIPIGKTFHEILTNNPKYLEHFDESIQSNIEITKDFNYQKWIDDNLKTHMAKFYQVDANTDYNLNQFDYELKTENFVTELGKKWLSENQNKVSELKYELGMSWNKYLVKNGYMIETALFTKFYNNNAGNYAKGITQGDYLVEGTEYDIAESEPFVKARSFQGKDNTLIDWYCTAIKEKYTEPFIYSETKLIKFGDGNKIAISLLESGSEKIAHPMGFDTIAYKIMKLVTRSQFLFQTEIQLRNFETNEETLANLSKELGLNQKSFWEQLSYGDIKEYSVELRDNVDYFNYAKTHPIGIGFELLTLSPSVKGDIEVIRNKIVDLIDNTCTNFGKYLNLQRNFKYGEPLKNLFAAIIIAKKNAEDDLRTLLENSANEPTILNVTQENIKRLHELKNECSDE